MTRPKLSGMQDAVAADLSDPTASSAPEARQVVRNEYPFPQRYAFYREGRWPTDEEFHLAELCDISSKGLALLLQERPPVEMLVVELGVGTNVSQVLAKIVQVSPNSAPGEKGYRVGCELVSSGTSF
jgi:hypothetical protein